MLSQQSVQKQVESMLKESVHGSDQLYSMYHSILFSPKVSVANLSWLFYHPGVHNQKKAQLTRALTYWNKVALNLNCRFAGSESTPQERHVHAMLEPVISYIVSTLYYCLVSNDSAKHMEIDSFVSSCLSAIKG